jgi:hypothetical protein
MTGGLRARYVCDRCGRDLGPRRLSSRCLCGDAVWRRIDPADTFGRPATADTPGWDPLKDWAAKYLQFTWNIAALRRLGDADSAADAGEVRRAIEATFRAARELADWLTAGPEPATVTPGDLDRFTAEEPLSVAVALGAAGEAGDRVDGPDRTGSAHLVPVGFARPPRFWVEHRAPAARPVRYDALDLAQRCLFAWQRFLRTRGVQLPSWS